MVPDYPSFCRRAVHPLTLSPLPTPLLRLVRSSPAIRVLVALRHRPSIFLFDRSSLPAVPALHYPFCCTMHVHPRVHKVRRPGLDWTIWVHGGPKRPCSNVPWSNVFQCNGKQRRSPRDQSRVLNFISAARLDAPERERERDSRCSESFAKFDEYKVISGRKKRENRKKMSLLFYHIPFSSIFTRRYLRRNISNKRVNPVTDKVGNAREEKSWLIRHDDNFSNLKFCTSVPKAPIPAGTTMR